MEGPFRLRFAICILILGFVSFNLCRTKGPNTDIPLVGTSIFPLYDIIDIMADESVDLF